ncbi:anti-anti-sigma factor [Marmoricola sp. URHA0025 HA25]
MHDQLELATDGTTLRIGGQLDVRCITELRTAVYDHLEAHSGHVVLDLSEVESADLTVLKMLAVASRSANQSGHRVTVQDCPDGVRRLLHLAHLRGLVTVESSADEVSETA